MKQELEQALAAVVEQLFSVRLDVELTRPAPQFGDYATNVALQLAKRLGKNPREVADTLARSEALMHASSDKIREVSVAGPGFLNLHLSDRALGEALEPHPTVRWSGEAVIETNNPNPFKAMHIGHAFNAILADTLANLIDASGAKTHRVSYHGDVGAHVGKSMWSILRYIQGDPNTLLAIPVPDRNRFMSRMYAEGATAYKENEQAKAEIDALAQQSFTLDDPLYRQVYETCKHWSFEQIDHLVQRLGNKPTGRRYLESEADALGVQTVNQHVPDVFQESNRALVFPGSKYGSFDNVFVSSTGRGLYGARDLGLMQLKHRDYPSATKSYIVTAEEQRDYFRGVIKAAELCLPALSGFTVNVSTGTVKLASGKMSSRTGDVLEVAWLFDQVAEAVKARGGQADDSIIAGALRYQFLRVRIGNDVVFDVAEAVSLQGNSGPYLQYAHARARSLLAKATASPAPITDVQLEAEERLLARKISEYGEVADRAVAELLPHHICGYLYELAQEFNRFYEHNRVLDDEREAVRLTLVHAYADTLKRGLELLGIHAPDHM